MSMFGGGFGGFGSQDQGVQDKLAALKAKKGNDPSAQVKDFLEKDLGVDMRELPFTLGDANQFLNKVCEDQGVPGLEVVGNSRGLTKLLFDVPQTDVPCPVCGGTNGWWEVWPTRWFCDDNCESEVAVPATAIPAGSEATEASPRNVDWHDMLRSFEALKKHAKFKRESDPDPTDTYSWKVVHGYREATIEPIEPVHVNPDPKSYPTGTVLRMEKRILDETGAVTVTSEYVRVGGLYSDDELTILATMQPIQDLTGWTVVEQI
jgi:endogenous inhibitor of DNA gyrase (YacG/DUF329 family)